MLGLLLDATTNTDWGLSSEAYFGLMITAIVLTAVCGCGILLISAATPEEDESANPLMIVFIGAVCLIFFFRWASWSAEFTDYVVLTQGCAVMNYTKTTHKKNCMSIVLVNYTSPSGQTCLHSNFIHARFVGAKREGNTCDPQKYAVGTLHDCEVDPKQCGKSLVAGTTVCGTNKRDCKGVMWSGLALFGVFAAVFASALVVIPFSFCLHAMLTFCGLDVQMDVVVFWVGTSVPCLTPYILLWIAIFSLAACPNATALLALSIPFPFVQAANALVIKWIEGHVGKDEENSRGNRNEKCFFFSTYGWGTLNVIYNGVALGFVVRSFGEIWRGECSDKTWVKGFTKFWWVAALCIFGLMGVLALLYWVVVSYSYVVQWYGEWRKRQDIIRFWLLFDAYLENRKDAVLKAMVTSSPTGQADIIVWDTINEYLQGMEDVSYKKDVTCVLRQYEIQFSGKLSDEQLNEIVNTDRTARYDRLREQRAHIPFVPTIMQDIPSFVYETASHTWQRKQYDDYGIDPPSKDFAVAHSPMSFDGYLTEMFHVTSSGGASLTPDLPSYTEALGWRDSRSPVLDSNPV